jgi:hypothetical protein
MIDFDRMISFETLMKARQGDIWPTPYTGRQKCRRNEARPLCEQFNRSRRDLFWGVDRWA